MAEPEQYELRHDPLFPKQRAIEVGSAIVTSGRQRRSRKVEQEVPQAARC